MKSGKVDISADAIGTGLAKKLMEHYAASAGPLRPLRAPLLLDDCRFNVVVICGDTAEDIQTILVQTSQTARPQDVARFHPEFAGASFGVTAHSINLQGKSAHVVTKEHCALILEDRHIRVIRDAVESILATGLEEVEH